MNILLNKKNQSLFLIMCTVILLLLTGITFLPYGQFGLILVIVINLVSIIGIFSGTVSALVATLILFFMVGSFLFWLPFFNISFLGNNIPLLFILLWMGILLTLSLLTGQLSYYIKSVYQDNLLLKEQMRQLVAVDPVTGFDNQDRMLLEIKMEYTRSKRYEYDFTLLLIKINHLPSFRKLYGEVEMSNLFKYLSTQIYELTRVSDNKFRPEEDLLGILLTGTGADKAQIVLNKLVPAIETFQLQNKKYVTIPIEYGFVSINDVSDFTEIYPLAKEQVSEYVS